MLARSASYSVGLVNNGTQGTDVGGLVGTSDIHVISSYRAPDSSDQTTSAGGSAKSLVEMMQVSTFIG